jgi:SAM-dependent methyltransferase
MLHTVRTGKPAFDKVYGVDYFEFLESNPAESELFNRAMGATLHAAVAILEQYDFSGSSEIVDVGGGDGLLLASVLARYPDLRGVLQEVPATIAAAPRVLAEAGVAQRCQLVEDSFFDSVVGGGDVYILSRVLHDWNDDNARRILLKVREAMKPGARLLIVDTVLPPVRGLDLGVLADLLMLVIVGGKERTEQDWRELLHDTGFETVRITDRSGEIATRGHSLIEAVPAAIP